MKHVRFFVLWIMLALFATTANAQGNVFNRKKARAADVAPKALLVMLSSEKNRHAYLVKQNDQKRIALLDQDTKMVIQKTVKDFTDNFRFCPVYFFMDTNTKKIAAGHFDDVLLDSTLHPAQNIVLQNGDTNFYIGCFGIPNSTYPSDTVQMVTARYYKARETGNLSNEIWYVMGHDFQLLPAPLPYTVYTTVKNPGYKMKAPASTYNYNSLYFDITYKASAWKYSATLSKYFLDK